MSTIKHTMLMSLLVINGIMLGLNCVNSNWFIIPINLITVFFIIKTLSEETK